MNGVVSPLPLHRSGRGQGGGSTRHAVAMTLNCGSRRPGRPAHARRHGSVTAARCGPTASRLITPNLTACGVDSCLSSGVRGNVSTGSCDRSFTGTLPGFSGTAVKAPNRASNVLSVDAVRTRRKLGRGGVPAVGSGKTGSLRDGTRRPSNLASDLRGVRETVLHVTATRAGCGTTLRRQNRTFQCVPVRGLVALRTHPT
jgi:hypothetical protein